MMWIWTTFLSALKAFKRVLQKKLSSKLCPSGQIRSDSCHPPAVFYLKKKKSKRKKKTPLALF